MTFEENPLLLIVFIVLTVEGWSLARRLSALPSSAAVRRRQESVGDKPGEGLA
jgi:hypothetical protein